MVVVYVSGGTDMGTLRDMTPTGFHVPAILGLALWYALAGAPKAAAQTPPVDGGIEISPIVGANRAFPFSFTEAFAEGLRLGGLGLVRVDAETNSQRVVGANVASHVSRFVLVFTEVLYGDFGESQVSGATLLGVSRTGQFILSPRVTIAYRPALLDWTGGVRVQFPTGAWRVRPYVAGGAGLLSLKQQAQGGGITLADRTNDLTFHVDAGVRVFLAGWFGLAPEFRVVRIPDDTFYRVLISTVFRFN
jgi:hypothetical protein